MKKKKLTIAILCCLGWLIMLSGFFAIRATTNRVNGTVKNLYGDNISVDSDYVNLTGEATQAIDTKLGIVKTCTGSISSLPAAATNPHHIICSIPTQTGSNRGKIILNANNVGDTASGTTVATYSVWGYGTK